jgi:crossover junction endodeoxyribonuclease RusA
MIQIGTDPHLQATIPGKPRGQGSLSLWRGPDGKERAKYGGEVALHRNLAVANLRDAWDGRPPITGPVAVRIVCEYPRPKAHYGTGRNAARLKDSAPHWVTTPTDIDKVARLVCDALTIAGVWCDDAQCVLLRAEKHYANDGTQGPTNVEVFALGVS